VSLLKRSSSISLKVRRRLRLPYVVQIEALDNRFRYRTDKSDALYVRTTESSFGGWERVPRQVFSALASNSRTVLDVGAYSGIYSLIALASSSTSFVHAIEPMPTNVRRTRRNLLLNDQFPRERWQIHQFAASDARGDVALYFNSCASLDTASLDQHFRESAPNRQSVKAMPLDYCNFKEVDLMKLDVEGHEDNTLRGARRILAESQPFVLFETLTEIKLDLCRSEFSAAGYEFTVLLDPRKHVYIAVPPTSSTESNERASLLNDFIRTENLNVQPIPKSSTKSPT
jgi:FkbM family methyltransferase